jgi:hypothetical protein
LPHQLALPKRRQSLLQSGKNASILKDGFAAVWSEVTSEARHHFLIPTFQGAAECRTPNNRLPSFIFQFPFCSPAHLFRILAEKSL